MGIRFGRIARADDAASGRQTPDWLYKPHWRYDGIGGFAELLRERGVPGIERLPTLKETSRPGTRVRFASLLRHLGRKRTRQAFERFDFRWTPSRPEPPCCSNAVGFRVFTRESTRALFDRAKDRGGSLNSLLLWSLDRTARETWLSASAAETFWMIPVNLRGGVRLVRDTANHLGLMDVELPRSPTVRQTHESVRRELARGGHWGPWSVMGLSRWLSRGAMRAMIRREVERGPVHTGIFSNLGEWGPAAGDPHLEETESAWLFAPQTSRMVPIAAGAVIWAGRLALTLLAHPMITVTDADVMRWAQRWGELACEA